MVCPLCRCPGAPCVPFAGDHGVPEAFDVVLDENCFRGMVSCIYLFFYRNSLILFLSVCVFVECFHETCASMDANFIFSSFYDEVYIDFLFRSGCGRSIISVEPYDEVFFYFFCILNMQ